MKAPHWILALILTLISATQFAHSGHSQTLKSYKEMNKAAGYPQRNPASQFKYDPRTVGPVRQDSTRVVRQVRQIPSNRGATSRNHIGNSAKVVF